MSISQRAKGRGLRPACASMRKPWHSVLSNLRRTNNSEVLHASDLLDLKLFRWLCIMFRQKVFTPDVLPTANSKSCEKKREPREMALINFERTTAFQSSRSTTPRLQYAHLHMGPPEFTVHHRWD